MSRPKFVRGIAACFTVNNPTEEDEELLLESDKWNYIIIGHEVGENETYHWQGYIQFKDRLTLNGVKKFLPRAHLEQVKGTQKQAIDYCKKGIQSKDEWDQHKSKGPNFGVDATWDEYGKLRGQGGARDKTASKKKYADIKERIAVNRDSLQKVVLEDCETPSHIHYAQFIEKYAGLGKKIRPVQVFWYYGPTGCGKSHTAFDLMKEDSYWMSSENLKWFDGYCGQEDVLIDDFRSSHCTFSWLLRILDKYPLLVPVKGSFVRWLPLRIFITSPYHPKDCYQNIEDKTQLMRRIKLIQKFDKRYVEDGVQELVDGLDAIDLNEEPEDPEIDPLNDPNDLNNPNYAYLHGL